MPFRSQHLSCCLRIRAAVPCRPIILIAKKATGILSEELDMDEQYWTSYRTSRYLSIGMHLRLEGFRTKSRSVKSQCNPPLLAAFSHGHSGKYCQALEVGISVGHLHRCRPAAGRGSSGRDSSGSDSPQQARRIRQRSERPDPAPRDPLNGPHPGIERNAGRRAILSVP